MSSIEAIDIDTKEDLDFANIIVENQRKKQNKQDSLDVLYDELEKPLLISVLYFLFQLPFMNVLLKKNLKILYILSVL